MGPPISADTIRAMFLARLSAMCKSEMPRYRAMTELVARVNADVLAAQPELAKGETSAGDGADLDIERHGAVRVGTPGELVLLRRLFTVMGMAPVGYYDLSVAGLPVHSTAFRPLTEVALRESPFRVFVSLLRLDLIPEVKLRDEVTEILARRSLLTPRGHELLDQFEASGGFKEEEAREFVAEAIEAFRWRPDATVSIDVYRRLHAAHPLLADIACFKGPHINHLAAPTLDIDAVQRAMRTQGFEPKEIIEGPPRRRCPILLRQTSFKALAEPVAFQAPGGGQATHTARFGEVEQRGAALTNEGRALYDRLLSAAQTNSFEDSSSSNAAGYERELSRQFEAFPDDYAELWVKELAFFRYRAMGEGLPRDRLRTPTSIESLLAEGYLSIEPILYEDFLPASAAGIFRSNLADRMAIGNLERASRQSFENALGCAVIDPLTLYSEVEAASLAASLKALDLPRTPPRRNEPAGSSLA